MLSGLAPARRRLVLVLLGALLVAAATLGVLLLVPGVTGAPPRAADQDRPGPVLLVPGYGGSTGVAAGPGRAADRGGRDATVVDLPGDGTGDLNAAAERARRRGAGGAAADRRRQRRRGRLLGGGRRRAAVGRRDDGGRRRRPPGGHPRLPAARHVGRRPGRLRARGSRARRRAGSWPRTATCCAG